MGAKHSLEDDLITFKLTSKQMARSAKKCDKNMAIQKEKLKKAIEQVRSIKRSGSSVHTNEYVLNVIGEHGWGENLCTERYPRKESVTQLPAARISSRCCGISIRDSH
jgi:hypothetical protein